MTGLMMAYRPEEGQSEAEQQAALEVMMEQATKTRVDYLAHKLLIRIEPMVNGVDMKEQIRQDLAQRLEAPGGGAILVTIGYAYQSEANKKLKTFLGLGGFAASVREKGHKVSQTWKLAKSYVALNSVATKLESDEKKRIEAGQTETEEEVARRAELEDHALQQGLAFLWKIGLFEIEDVTRKACYKILHDYAPDVTHDLRQKRAHALQKIGGWYQKWAKKYVKDAAGVLAELGAMDPSNLARSSESDTSSGEASSSSPGAVVRADSAPTPPPRPHETAAQTQPSPRGPAEKAPTPPPRPAETTAQPKATAKEEAEPTPIILGAPPAQ